MLVSACATRCGGVETPPARFGAEMRSSPSTRSATPKRRRGTRDNILSAPVGAKSCECGSAGVSSRDCAVEVITAHLCTWIGEVRASEVGALRSGVEWWSRGGESDDDGVRAGLLAHPRLRVGF